MSRAGLTLLELVVALSVTGLAVTGGYATFASLIDHRERVLGASEEVGRASAARAALVEWLEGAYLTDDPGTPQFQGLDGVHRDGPDDQLAFFTVARTPLDAERVVVRLYVDRDEATPEEGLVARLSEWRGRQAAVVEVEPRARGLELRYRTDLFGDDRWLPSWVSSTLLPSALEVTISGAPDAPLPPLMGVPIVVPFGGSR